MTAVTTVGEELREGALIVNDAAVEVFPPLDTVIEAIPAEAIRFALTDAVSWVELTNVVERPVPFHWTAAPEAKLVPLTFSVNEEAPAVAEDGDRLAMVGVLTLPDPVMEKCSEKSGVAEPSQKTWIVHVPGYDAADDPLISMKYEKHSLVKPTEALRLSYGTPSGRTKFIVAESPTRAPFTSK